MDLSVETRHVCFLNGCRVLYINHTSINLAKMTSLRKCVPLMGKIISNI